MSQKHDRVHPLLPNAHIMSFLRRRLCENSNAFRTEHLGESHIDAYLIENMRRKNEKYLDK